MKDESVSVISNRIDPHDARHVFQNIHFHASPESRRRLVVPRVNDTAPHMFPYRCGGWSVRFGGVKPKWLQSIRWGVLDHDQDIRLGAVSSVGRQIVSARSPLVPSPINDLPMLVALRMLMAKSASVLRNALSDKVLFNPASAILTDSSWPLGYNRCVLRGEEWRNVGEVCRVNRLRTRTAHRRSRKFALTGRSGYDKLQSKGKLVKHQKKIHVGVRAMTLMGNGKVGACRESWRRLSRCELDYGESRLSPSDK